MDAVVACAGITKGYDRLRPEVLAVRGVDLAVAPGEMVTIMGPSGCGKSTLLHLLGGLDVPTSGQVLLEGRRFDDLSEARRAIVRRTHVGYVFQFFNLITNLTVADNVELPMLLGGRSPRDARVRRSALLERLGVAEHAGKSPAALSGGQQQRVAIARALSNEPALLLADEPTGNLDSEATEQVITLLHEHHEHGQTIVLVSHDPRLGRSADRVLVMEDGRISSETRTEPALGGG